MRGARRRRSASFSMTPLTLMSRLDSCFTKISEISGKSFRIRSNCSLESTRRRVSSIASTFAAVASPDSNDICPKVSPGPSTKRSVSNPSPARLNTLTFPERMM